MTRVAIFVDAGYLFAQGSAALCGSKRSRTDITINASEAVSRLARVAEERAPGSRVLRVYWYDGAIGGVRPTADQALLANLDDVKLRLGFVNSRGQQKGVDSLIVTDLIELARLKSISDAVLLSGDEDVRVGVQIAQNYGVRVHLLGIVPSRGSQSQQLLQEADTTTEWDAETLRAILSVRESVELERGPAASAVKDESSEDRQINPEILAHVDKFVGELTQSDLDGIAAYWETERGVPPEFDRKLLPICGAALGRNLDRDEIRHMRAAFRLEVQKRNSN